ncbi:ribosome recycling factor [Candidatus Nomurabacteria bacterium]|nr:ribosome recycling factor [Candidatus Nomurabacteria bacterium]
MAYDFKPFEKRIKEILEHAGKELSGVRTGRAAPAILDGVFVESYGSRMPINQVASVSVDDPRSLRISPYDQSLAKEIEKAITVANLGVSVGSDERGVRVMFPELTGERRTQMIKLAKEKVEESRTSLRKARDEVWQDIQKQEKEGTMTEDEKFRSKDEMEKRVKAAGVEFDGLLERKEKEING